MVVILAVLRRMTGRRLKRHEIDLLARAVFPAVSSARDLHYGLAREFYTSHTPTEGFVMPEQRPWDSDMLTKGIEATVRTTLVGDPGFDTPAVATAIRHSRAAGTDSIRDATEKDPVATGWARVHTGPKQPCAFCRMLISRGPVYRSEETAHFVAHNGCTCLPVPMFKGRKHWDGRDQYLEYRKQWDELTAGHSGDNALNAFRRGIYREQTSSE